MARALFSLGPVIGCVCGSVGGSRGKVSRGGEPDRLRPDGPAGWGDNYDLISDAGVGEGEVGSVHALRRACGARERNPFERSVGLWKDLQE